MLGASTGRAKLDARQGMLVRITRRRLDDPKPLAVLSNAQLHLCHQHPYRHQVGLLAKLLSVAHRLGGNLLFRLSGQRLGDQPEFVAKSRRIALQRAKSLPTGAASKVDSKAPWSG